MIKYFCDRCGVETLEHENVYLAAATETETALKGDVKSKDYCLACLRKLNEFLGGNDNVTSDQIIPEGE